MDFGPKVAPYRLVCGNKKEPYDPRVIGSFFLFTRTDPVLVIQKKTCPKGGYNIKRWESLPRGRKLYNKKGLSHTIGGGKSHTGGLYCQRIPCLEVVYNTPFLHTY